MPQPPNMQQMLKQVQKMQADMMAAQDKLKDERVEASAGGGMVKVVVSGDLEVKEITIAPDAIDPDDPELLADLVLAAVNEGLRSAQELAATKLGVVTPQQLRKGRRYALVVIAVMAMLLPGQDPVTMLIMMVPLIVLYEGSILLASLLDRRASRALAREDAELAAADDGELLYPDRDDE